MKKEKRKPGLYIVELLGGGTFEIGKFSANIWELIGSKKYYNDSDLFSIGPRIEMPSLAEINIIRNEFCKGQDVYFEGEKLPYVVNSINENYAVCTRNLHKVDDLDILSHRVKMDAFSSISEAYKYHRNDVVYTILDFRNNIRGPHNSYGFSIEKESINTDCEAIIEAMESGEIEISSRNNVELKIHWR